MVCLFIKRTLSNIPKSYFASDDLMRNIFCSSIFFFSNFLTFRQLGILRKSLLVEILNRLLIFSVVTLCSANSAKNVSALQLINEKKRKKKGSKYADSGTLSFSSVTAFHDHSFLEYIAGG